MRSGQQCDCAVTCLSRYCHAICKIVFRLLLLLGRRFIDECVLIEGGENRLEQLFVQFFDDGVVVHEDEPGKTRLADASPLHGWQKLPADLTKANTATIALTPTADVK